MSRLRSALVAAAVMSCGTALFACTFTRSLDYLTKGEEGVPEGGASSTSSSGGPSSSSSSSSSSSGDVVTPAGEVLAASQISPKLLRADVENLYWVADNTKVMKVAKSGGAAVELSTVSGIADMAVSPGAGGKIFVLTSTTVTQIDKATPAPPAAFSAVPLTDEAIGIVADDAHVWLLASKVDDDTYATVVTRYVIANPAADVALFKPANDSDPLAIGIAPGIVFWNSTVGADLPIQQLATNAPAGTAPTTFKGGADGILVNAQGNLIADDTAFYFLQESDVDTSVIPYVLARTDQVGAGRPLLNTSSDFLKGLGVDAQYIYALEAKDNDSRLIRFPKDGRAPDSIAAPPNPAAMVSDDKALYVAFSGLGGLGPNGGIQRIPR